MTDTPPPPSSACWNWRYAVTAVAVLIVLYLAFTDLRVDEKQSDVQSEPATVEELAAPVRPAHRT